MPQQIFLTLILCLSLHPNLSGIRAAAAISAPARSNKSATPEDYIRRQGRNLVVGEDNSPIQLRGIGLSGYIFHMWEEHPEEIIDYENHSEIDFQRIAALGMNTVRIALYYGMFEDDNTPYTYKQEAWDWLDQRIAWGNKYGIYLILDMHIPPGIDRSGNGNFWSIPDNINRLKALWRAIAGRYRDKPIVAGYELLNEPGVTYPAEWRNLAQELIDEIRQIDTQHLLIVANICSCSTCVTDDYYHFPVNDSTGNDNVMYTFHTYYPFEYTYQLFDNFGDGGGLPG